MTMRLKPTYQNHLKDWMKGTIILYSILIAIYLISFIFIAIQVSGSDESSFSGMEFVSQIFIFVTGIAMFKPNLKLALANGISRKTEFTSAILAASTVAVAFVFLNLGINGLYGIIYPYQSEFNQAFGNYTFANNFTYYLTGFFYDTFSALTSFIFGYFIGALYYRMPKWLRILVSVGVPVLCFIGVPIVSVAIFADGINNGNTLIIRMAEVVVRFIAAIAANPYYTILCSIAFIAAFGTFTFLLIRRAPIKEQG